MKRFAFLLVVVLGLVGCQKTVPTENFAEEAPKSEHHDTVTLTTAARALAGIRIEAVTEGLIQAGIEVPGSVSIPSNSRAMVTPPVAGKIVRLWAGLGDQVKVGQPLAEIQSADLSIASAAIAAAENDLEMARSRVRQSQAALDLARGQVRSATSNLARQQRFANAGAFSQPAIQSAKNELNEAQSELLSAQAEEASHIAQLDRAERLFREGLVSQNDLETARLERRQDEVRLARARSRIELAQRGFEREQRIGNLGLANSREVGQAEANLRTAKLGVDQAQIDLVGAQTAMNGAARVVQNAKKNASASRGGSPGGDGSVTITAPISGRIVERQATLGQAVERSTDLFEIEDSTFVWVTANVPEADVSRIQTGTKATVTTSAYPEKLFSGVVDLMGSHLDERSRTLPVQSRIANADGLLRANLFARVRLSTGAASRRLSVPLSALSKDETYVFVEEDGRFEMRPVKLGQRDGRRVEVLSGLSRDERVVTSGVFILASELKKAELKGHED